MMENMANLAVTVVMPVYRESERHLRLAIESILKQTWRNLILIIILDDPCNDLLKNVIDSYAEADARVVVYVNEKNMGCPYSKDRGIRLADTEYVAIMDADDVSREQRLEKQLHKIVNEGLDIVAGCVRVVDDNGEPLYCMDRLPLRHDDIVKKMNVNNCMPHPTWMLKKNVYIKLGGYADMQGCEDYDFLIRAIKEGYRLGMVGEILLDYRLSPKSVSRNNLYRQYLMMQYLQDMHYTHKHNYKNFDDIYRQKYTEKRAQKYARAALHFENTLMYRSKRMYFRMAASLFMAVTGSGDYCQKILRYIFQNG